MFLAVAIAGISSVPWAVVGGMAIESAVVFGPRVYDLFHSNTIETTLPLLLTGPILLLNAYFNPGGSAEMGMQQRDNWLRRVARRRRIVSPALLTDQGTGAEAMPVPTSLDKVPIASATSMMAAPVVATGPLPDPPLPPGVISP
jgi:hypothetical protein